VDRHLQVKFEDIEDAEGVKPAVVKVSFEKVQKLVSQHDGEPLSGPPCLGSLITQMMVYRSLQSG
jgi:hypothetical protein